MPSLAQKWFEQRKDREVYAAKAKESVDEGQPMLYSAHDEKLLLAYVSTFNGHVRIFERDLSAVDAEALAKWLLVVTAGHEYNVLAEKASVEPPF